MDIFVNEIENIRKSKQWSLMCDILFPILMTVLCFIKVNKGLDITDSVYSCGNFAGLDKLDGMWFFSTFYANLIGFCLYHLPYGNTLIALNIYTGLCKLALALSAYYFFTKTVKAGKEVSFACIMSAVSLCWCPTTILYNYLTYLFFFLGCMFLYMGLIEEKKGKLIIAGFLLGSNVFVRLPNVVEASMILALWFYSIIKKEKFLQCLKKTGYCVLGYVLAFVPALVLIVCTRGIGAYIQGIQELFEMSGDVESYSAVGMVVSIVRQYIETWKYTEHAVFMLLICLLCFLVIPAKLKWLRYMLSTFVTLSFIFLLYKRGMFLLNFHWFEPVYRYGAVILSIEIVWFLVSLFLPKVCDEDKLLSIMTLGVICITPIGSNNDIYSNLNNLFWVLPVFGYQVVRFKNNNEHFRGIRYSITVFSLVWFILCFGFGITYVFRDGLPDKMDTKVANSRTMVHMKTTKDNAEMLMGLNDLWKENDFANREVLLYGDVCGLSFYLETPCAIATTWPSLPSYSARKFEKDLAELEENISDKQMLEPIVILDSEYIFSAESSDLDEKQKNLRNFMEEYSYKLLYSGDKVFVYEAYNK